MTQEKGRRPRYLFSFYIFSLDSMKSSILSILSSPPLDEMTGRSPQRTLFQSLHGSALFVLRLDLFCLVLSNTLKKFRRRERNDVEMTSERSGERTPSPSLWLTLKNANAEKNCDLRGNVSWLESPGLHGRHESPKEKQEKLYRILILIVLRNDDQKCNVTHDNDKATDTVDEEVPLRRPTRILVEQKTRSVTWITKKVVLLQQNDMIVGSQVTSVLSLGLQCSLEDKTHLTLSSLKWSNQKERLMAMMILLKERDRKEFYCSLRDGMTESNYIQFKDRRGQWIKERSREPAVELIFNIIQWLVQCFSPSLI
jgi:hypothetical protein